MCALSATNYRTPFPSAWDGFHWVQVVAVTNRPIFDIVVESTQVLVNPFTDDAYLEKDRLMRANGGKLPVRAPMAVTVGGGCGCWLLACVGAR